MCLLSVLCTVPSARHVAVTTRHAAAAAAPQSQSPLLLHHCNSTPRSHPQLHLLPPRNWQGCSTNSSTKLSLARPCLLLDNCRHPSHQLHPCPYMLGLSTIGNSTPWLPATPISSRINDIPTCGMKQWPLSLVHSAGRAPTVVQGPTSLTTVPRDSTKQARPLNCRKFGPPICGDYNNGQCSQNACTFQHICLSCKGPSTCLLSRQENSPLQTVRPCPAMHTPHTLQLWNTLYI